MMRLLSRYAEAIYWLARYIERTENLARILDINETFSRDSRGGQNWASVIQLYNDEELFAKHYDAPSAENVLTFYLIDAENPSSIVSSVKAARENARALRPLISTEMWIHINTFYNRMRALRPEDIAEERLARLCSQIKESCQAHTGITEGTFYRDEGWYFYEIGRSLERADQTTRLLDVKYHLLLPNLEAVGSPLDVSQWNTVLRSAAGYHAFRRMQPSGMTASKVAEFMLLDRRFPRSVWASMTAVNLYMTELKSRYMLRGGAQAMEHLDELRALLDNEPIDRVLERGLHEFIDGIQVHLINVNRAIGEDFFGWEAAQSQTQSAN